MVKDSTKIRKYASQSRYNALNGWRAGHEEMREVLSKLTLKHGHRTFKLKNIDYFEFTAEHMDNKGLPVYTVIYFDVQKINWNGKYWLNYVEHFKLYIQHEKNLEKYDWSGYRSPIEAGDNQVTIQDRDFKFDSTIRFKTKTRMSTKMLKRKYNL